MGLDGLISKVGKPRRCSCGRDMQPRTHVHREPDVRATAKDVSVIFLCPNCDVAAR